MGEKLEEIKAHTQWTVDNGIVPRIDDSDLAWLINTVEEQQKEIEQLKHNSTQERKMNKDLHQLAKYLQENPDLAKDRWGESVSLIALDALQEQQQEIELTKADADLYKSIRDGQAHMIRKLHDENSRLRDYLILIRNTGTFGTDINTKEVVRSDEANLAHEALEQSK